jgi:nitrogen regulatory protein P-II 2
MKLVIAYVQPEKVGDVKRKLFEAQIFKISIVPNALGAGQQKGYTEEYRGVIREVNLRMKVRIEIAVNNEFVKPTVDAIIAGARTGNIGDGKIFVVALEDCIRIRTGETGSAAIG